MSRRRKSGAEGAAKASRFGLERVLNDVLRVDFVRLVHDDHIAGIGSRPLPVRAVRPAHHGVEAHIEAAPRRPHWGLRHRAANSVVRQVVIVLTHRHGAWGTAPPTP